jgi:hypothetical protein
MISGLGEVSLKPEVHQSDASILRVAIPHPQRTPVRDFRKKSKIRK